MKVYLAGPMSGIEDYNFPAFFKYAKVLEDQGHTVFNPAQNDLDNWKDLEGVKKHANYRDCLGQDLNWICYHAEAIALIPGWEKSKGVQAELATARAIGLEVIEL